MGQRKTKIICTIGPASETPEIAARLVEGGMDVARLNLSHGTHEDHRRNYTHVRGAAQRLGRNVAILMDLQGPKIRTGALRGGESVLLRDGAPITITTDEVEGDDKRISTSYEHLPRDVRPGDRLLIADGALELRAEEVKGSAVNCTVVRGGMLGEHKGINLPGVNVSAPSLTGKDAEDLRFGLELGVDYVALSFVRRPEDVTHVKSIIQTFGSDAQVIAKVERPEAVQHIDGIISAADAIMVARGDLGVEMNFDDVPQIQKDIIRRCNETGVPVITATQMLESMIKSSMPTRAEATDAANAVYDGTDAVMLSGETAVGEYPVEAVDVVARIVAKADEAKARLPYHRPAASAGDGNDNDFAGAISEAVYHTAEALRAVRIVCFTISGHTARAIAGCRPAAPITVMTPRDETLRRCALYWGAEAFPASEVPTSEALVEEVETLLLKRGLAQAGDAIIITAGTPLSVPGRTNMIRIHRIGAR